jgi:4-amino-4-deoxychorismate lyase
MSSEQNQRTDHGEAVLVNGVPAQGVPVRDRGLQFGDGLFETCAVIGGRLRFWQRHWRRLETGCQRLGLATPKRALIESEATGLCHGIERAVLKIVLTRGDGAQGYRPPRPEHGRRILRLLPWPASPPEWDRDGIEVCICRTRLGLNPTLAGIKHLNRLEQVLARAEWDDPKIAEGLTRDVHGRVIEGTAANLFLVKDGQILTPALVQAGVAGVMRGWVLETVAQLSLRAAEVDMTLPDVLAADEVYMTNALVGVRPVRRLGEQPFAVGPVTRALQRRLAALTREEMGIG